MISTYNIWLVMLSIIIAFLASYTALDLAFRVMHSSGRARTSWLVGGSVSMGVGIWAMHFIGMLAFHLPIPLAYGISITLISVVPAIAASAIALWTIRRGDPGVKVLLVSAIVMGVGIAVMHYTGMAALKMQPPIEYDPLLFALSVAIAIAASLAALKIILLLESYRGSANTMLLKLTSAAVMAVAITGMHYTGMAAAHFHTNSMSLASPQGLSGETMALLIGVGSLLVMLVTLLVSIFDQRLGDQNARMAEKLRLSNNELQARANELLEAVKEAMHAKEQAEQSSLELSGYIQAIGQHAIISVTDKAGRITQLNDRFCEISGYTRAELLGQDHRIINSGTHPKEFFAQMWSTLAQGDIWRGEICNRAKSGTLYWVDSAIVPIKDTLGHIERFLAVRIETTKRKRMEMELHNRYEEVLNLNSQLNTAQNHLLQSEKMASIGQLAAGVAHEINNPIGYVYSNLGTLEKYVQDTFGMLKLYEQAEDAISDAEVRAKLKAAKDKLDLVFLKEDLRALMDESKDGITRVKIIVQNLKDFSHVNASDEWHYADLHSGIDSTLNIVNNEIKYKATVVKEYGELPEVESLSSQLNQVFMNLLVNASHAIEERGTITIRTGRQGDEVWVEVADTGKGIAPEHLNKIFDPFFTTKPIGKGTGLGLSLAYGIVQKHHGRIEVHSEVGKGTAFKVWLPVKQPQDQQA